MTQQQIADFIAAGLAAGWSVYSDERESAVVVVHTSGLWLRLFRVAEMPGPPDVDRLRAAREALLVAVDRGMIGLCHIEARPDGITAEVRQGEF